MKRLLLIILTSTIMFYIFQSLEYAKYSPTQDFAAFYCAANISLDPAIPNGEMYDNNSMETVGQKLGLNLKPAPYVYSPAAVYFFIPFALLPYQTAKIAFNLFNLVIYIASIILVLKLNTTSFYRALFLLAASLLWVSLWYNQFWLQSNPLLLLFIVLAVFLAVKNHPVLSGILFGAAVLLKIYPIAIVMVIGLKNWRILAVCALTVCLTMFLPDSGQWLAALHKTHYPNYTEIYLCLSSYSFYLYVSFVIVIAGLTAIAAYISKNRGYPFLATLAVPAAILSSPVVGGYYLVILMLCYIYLFMLYKRPQGWLMVLVISSFGLINYTMFIYDSFTIGVFILWLALVTSVFFQPDFQTIQDYNDRKWYVKI